MRKPRPNAYNPAQALFLISNDRSGSPLSCPSCSGSIERDPREVPPPQFAHVTLRCKSCGRTAHYVAGAAESDGLLHKICPTARLPEG